MDEPLERCDNCLKDFPEGKIATHFGYCRRNIKKCQDCGQMYDINFKEDHFEEYHKKESCPHCKLSFPSSDLKKHESGCKSKPRQCEYCDLPLPAASYNQHLKECQSRTKPCFRCSKPIMNKQYLVHSVSCDGVVQSSKPKPQEVNRAQQASNYEAHIAQQQKKQVIRQAENNAKERQAFNKQREERNYAQINNNPKQQNPKVYQYQKVENQRKMPPPQFPTYNQQPQQYSQLTSTATTNKNVLPKQQSPQQYDMKKHQISNEPLGKEDQRKQINKPRQEVPVYSTKNKDQVKLKHQEIVEKLKREKEDKDKRLLQQPTRYTGKPITNKNMFPSSQQQYGKIVANNIKDNKSVERKEPVTNSYKYANQNVNPAQYQKKEEKGSYKVISANNVLPNSSSRQAPQQNKIAPSTKPEAQKYQKQPQFESYEESGQNFSQMDDGISLEDKLYQEAIMNSLIVKGKKSQPKVNQHEYNGFQIEGEDFMNQSFIEKQRAIENDMKGKRPNKR